MSESIRHAISKDPADTGVLSRLNGVRMIIVLFIAFGYASTMPNGPGALEWLNTFGYDPSLFGIQVLFFISGWLALRSLFRGATVFEFFFSRAKRLLPWLAVYTFIVAAVLYPALKDPNAAMSKDGIGLARYFCETVFLINPGQPMAGALDNALYPCLLQGGVWTLRWGLIAYIGFVFVYKIGLRHRGLYLGLLAVALLSHMGASWLADQTDSGPLAPVIPGLRLSASFLLGINAFAWQDKLPKDSLGWLKITVITLGLALIHYLFLPWTYAIELIAMMGWCALSMTLLQMRSPILQNWPPLFLPMLFGAWPTSQVLLAAFPMITVPALIALTLAIAFTLAVCFIGLRNFAHGRVQTA